MSNHALDLIVGLGLIVALVLIGLAAPDDAWQRHLELRGGIDDTNWLARP